MNTQDKDNLSASLLEQQALKDKVRGVVAARDYMANRRLIKQLAAELKLSFLDCAAALAYLNGVRLTTASAPEQKLHNSQIIHPPAFVRYAGVKLVRYRLDVGQFHKITLEQLKAVLVEESGVDVKNIANVRIQDVYTLIDLPDEMPQEVFHHLREVQINGQALAIKRLKSRSKKRGNRKYRRPIPRDSTLSTNDVYK
jgi:DbpA RNA binding domain